MLSDFESIKFKRFTIKVYLKLGGTCLRISEELEVDLFVSIGRYSISLVV